jgi:CPA1 family monovalent cation:H+ antiporter
MASRLAALTTLPNRERKEPPTTALITITNVEEIVLLLVLAIVVALIARRLRFPYTLALVLVGLVLGFVHVDPQLRLDPDLVLLLFLPALLFEGAWNVDVRALRANWLAVALLAGPGLLISLGVVALALRFGAGLPIGVALLIGAIVSPTDPVAVLALLRQLGMPRRLRLLVEAESLFNDGVGVVAFEIILGTLLLSVGVHSELMGGAWWAVTLKVIWLLVGGPLIGVALGYFVSLIISRFNDHLLETAITFCVAYGSYLLANELRTSGLLAVVCAALTMGSYGRRVGMSQQTAEAVDLIWEFVSFIANCFLFLLLGIQIGEANLAPAVSPIIWAVIGVVAGRALMIYVLLPLHDALGRWRAARAPYGSQLAAPIPPQWRPLLLLSGLRGALSIALALSLPLAAPQRNTLAIIVYAVVLVTLVGQGIAMRFLLPRWPGLRRPQPTEAVAD